jgi:hypothetical protein
MCQIIEALLYLNLNQSQYDIENHENSLLNDFLLKHFWYSPAL